MKKLSLLLIIMTLFLAQFNLLSVHAADPLSGDFYYVVNADTTSVTITGYTDSAPRDIVIIPDTIDGKTVTAIGNEAFIMKSIESIVLPNTLVLIGNRAFEKNLLISVEIPDSVKRVGNDSFVDNYIHTLTLHQGLEEIGSSAFAKNKITVLELPDSIVRIGNSAFHNNIIETLTLPKNLTTINNEAFIYNKLTTLVIPDTVTTIGESAFAGNRLSTLEIPASVTTIKNQAFFYNALTSVTFLGTPTIAAASFDEQYLNSFNDYLYNWFLDIDLTQTWDKTVSSPITIYAAWKKNTVTFNSTGGTAVNRQVINFQEKASTPTAPTRAGYTFAGWYKDSDVTTAWNFGTDVVTANTTLYAKWTLNNYTVSFNSNGGTAVDSQTVGYNQPVAAPTAPTRAGYTFDGWYKDSDVTTAWNVGTDVVTANTTLYAKWTLNNYTVSFNSNGGTAVDSQTVGYNQPVAAPTAPTRAGYTFDGWYKDDTLTTKWDFITDVVDTDTTLYAKWRKYTVVVAPEPTIPEPTPLPEEEPTPEVNVCPTVFSDTANHWAEGAIKTIANQCIIFGFPDGEFKPDAPLIRAHVAVMLNRALELTPTRPFIGYKDIVEGSSNYSAILKTSQSGIFEGTKGYFYPEQYLTRAQMAKILVIAFNLPLTDKKSTFQDVPEAHWASAYIASLESNNLAFGEKGYYRPEESVTRAQFVAFMYRALESSY